VTPQTHTVVAGDTLSKIAAQFGVTVADLVAWNGLANPDSIAVGQVLKVSAPKA
jgi:lipoprotein NlpD